MFWSTLITHIPEADPLSNWTEYSDLLDWLSSMNQTKYLIWPDWTDYPLQTELNWTTDQITEPCSDWTELNLLNQWTLWTELPLTMAELNEVPGPSGTHHKGKEPAWNQSPKKNP